MRGLGANTFLNRFIVFFTSMYIITVNTSSVNVLYQKIY